MSFAALAWAAKQKTGGLATKAVLLALANYADEYGCAYPSTAAIAAFGEMDHKTATGALDRLSAAGLIVDTGNRAGHTKQIKVFRLALESQPQTEAFQNRKPPNSEPKAPQKRGTDTVRDTIPQKATPSSGSRPSKGAPVPADFVPVMTPGSMTAEAVAGWPPGELEEQIEHFIDRHTTTGTLSRDWQASWRTWVKNWKKFNGQRLQHEPTLRGPRPSPALTLARAGRAAEALIAANHPPDDSASDWGAWGTLQAIGSS